MTIKWDRYKVLNLINDKYNLIPFEITSYEEADDFYFRYLAPIADIDPVFFDRVDGEIGLAIIDNWTDREELSKAVIPLLVKSTITKELGGIQNG